MEHRDGSFAAQGLELYYQCWHRDSGRPRGTLAIVHGLGEHSGRYSHVVNHLVPLGYAVYGFDLRGFGRSPGRRGHIDAWSQFRGDVDAFLRRVREDHPDHVEEPLFLLGHSMGGLIALDYVLRHGDSSAGVGLAGAVISGAGLEPIGVAKPWLVRLAHLLSRIWPTCALDVGVDAAAISRDSEEVKAYQADPLVHRRGTARWGVETMAATEWIKANAARFRIPFLMIHGGDDRLVSPEGSRAFFADVTFDDKELRIYEGGYHEPHNDIDYELVLNDVTVWLERHLPSVT